jgi:hypothetical protein
MPKRWFRFALIESSFDYVPINRYLDWVKRFYRFQLFVIGAGTFEGAGLYQNKLILRQQKQWLTFL